MLDGVHRHTTHLRPAVTLHLVLVVGTTSLQDGLIDTATTGDDTDHGTVGRWQHLLRARRQLHARPLRVGVVRDDRGVVTRGTGQLAPIAGLLLQVAHDRTLRHQTDRQHVADLQLGPLATVHELTGVHALSRNEQLLAQTELVRIAEVHDRQRSTTARIVDDLLHDTLQVTVTFGVIEITQLRLSLALLGVCPEHGSGTFTLRANNASHFDALWGAKIEFNDTQNVCSLDSTASRKERENRRTV
uniref:Secreted protein n=1 Tax=Anopheles marajoara TaxID=58244 RepID=A0A2M4BY68_9DIPT